VDTLAWSIGLPVIGQEELTTGRSFFNSESFERD
jgi:hypothetical protein